MQNKKPFETILDVERVTSAFNYWDDFSPAFNRRIGYRARIFDKKGRIITFELPTPCAFGFLAAYIFFLIVNWSNPGRISFSNSLNSVIILFSELKFDTKLAKTSTKLNGTS